MIAPTPSALDATGLLRLVYASTCVRGIAERDVRDILARSKENNFVLGITGMLCWSGEFFLQCLEGPRRPVTRLFSKIASDPRHADVELIIAAPTQVRWFDRWAMGFTRDMMSHGGDVRATNAAFNPYALQASDLLELFERLSQSAQPM